LAGFDYQQKMGEVFTECRRVLKEDGVMTLMFTHKATGAWDALTKGLMEDGFAITTSWPINTEAEGSLHIKDKSAANSTVLLVCRPRPPRAATDDVYYWEDLEPRLKDAVRRRIQQFQAASIRGDLYLSCFGPALEEFSRHWPVRRGQLRPMDQMPRWRRRTTPDESADHDPYAVTPDDALDAARREVKAWPMETLTLGKRRARWIPSRSGLCWPGMPSRRPDSPVTRPCVRPGKGRRWDPPRLHAWIDALHHCAHRAKGPWISMLPSNW